MTILATLQLMTSARSPGEDDALKEYITKVILLIMGITLAMFTILIVIGWIAGAFTSEPVAIMLLLDLPVSLGWWLAHKGRWRLAGYVPPAVVFLLAGYLNYSAGGTDTTGLLFYLIAILLVSVLQGVKAQWFTLGLSIGVYFLNGFFHDQNTLEILLPATLTASGAFTGVALLQWFFVSQLKQALASAREKTNELRERSAQLTIANQDLHQEIAHRKQAQEELRQSAYRLKVLHEIDKAVLAAQSPPAIAQAGLDHIRNLVPCQRASVTLFDFEKGIANILALNSDDDTPFKQNERIPLDYFGVISELRQGESRVIPDLRSFPECTPIETQLLSKGFRTIANLPLISQEKLIGSLNLGAIEPGAFAVEHVEIAQELADSLAVAIQNVLLFQETQQQAQMMLGLYETALSISGVLGIDILMDRLSEQVHKLLSPDTFLVALCEGEEVFVPFVQEDGRPLLDWVGSRFSLDQGGLTGWVIRTGQPVLVGDMEKDDLPVKPKHGTRPARSWLGVPMVGRDGVAGALSVQSFQPHAFNNRHLHFMESLAAQVAIGLENTRLFEEIERQLRRLQALQSIDRSILGSVDLALTMDIVLTQVLSQLNVDAADILLFNLNTHTLDFAAGHGFRTNALQHTHLRLGEGGAGRAAQERTIYSISDLNQHHTGFLRSPLFREERFIENYAVPLITKGQLKGVMEIFHRSPLHPDQNWLEFLKALAGQAAIAIDNAELFANLQIANDELLQAYDSTIEGWSHALDLRDRETEGHSQRVTELTLRLARAYGLGEKDLVHIRWGALLHDIGKMGIPDSILLKPGPLTPEEWETMHRHPVHAYEFIFPIHYLRPALEIPYCHHEKWDGSGYPRGLKGEEIPLSARLFAVVDVWDALRSDRPYRKAWSPEEALAHIKEQANKHFDPQVVELFLQIL